MLRVHPGLPGHLLVHSVAVSCHVAPATLAHRKLLVFVLGRLLVLLDQEATASLEDAPIWLELGPDLELAIPLDEAQRRIELKVRLEVLRESQLDFHCVGAPVVQYDF